MQANYGYEVHVNLTYQYNTLIIFTMAELIVVQGYPGSGKSTQSEQLVDETLDGRAVFHVSAGNRLREVRSGASDSRYANDINSPIAPSPLPDEVVNGVIFEAVESQNDSSLVLIDGYPRHPSAIDVFARYINKHEHDLLGVVNFNISLETSMQRVGTRGVRSGEKMRGATLEELAIKRYRDHGRLTTIALELLGEYTSIDHIDANDNQEIVWKRFRRTIGRLAINLNS